MSSFPVSVQRGFSQNDDYRVWELPEKLIPALCEGMPQDRLAASGAEAQIGSKRARGEDDSHKRLVLTVRGNEDEVIVCTHSTSFSLRRHEFSNNFYLMTADEHVIHEKANFVCEVHPTRTRLETLRPLIVDEEDAYLTLEEVESWSSAEASSSSSSFERPNTRTFQQLVKKSMCSRTEVANFLIGEGAIIVKGEVRLLHPALRYQVMEAAIHEVHRREGGGGGGGADEVMTAESNWSLDAFCLDVLVQSLASLYPPVVTRAVLSRLTAKREKDRQPTASASEGAASEAACGTNGDEVALHAFVRKSVMVGIAESIINPSVTNPNTSPMGTQNIASPLNDTNRKKFLTEWKSRISSLASHDWLVAPSEPATSDSAPNDQLLLTDGELMSFLEGLVFTNNDTNSSETAVVTWCPHWRLPIALPARISHLLSRKPRWPANELKPYLLPCLEIGQGFDNAVGKYCREIRSADKSVPSTYIAA